MAEHIDDTEILVEDSRNRTQYKTVKLRLRLGLCNSTFDAESAASMSFENVPDERNEQRCSVDRLVLMRCKRPLPH